MGKIVAIEKAKIGEIEINFYKIFIEKDQSLIFIIPLLIIIAFTTKGMSLYFPKSTMINVGESIKKNLQYNI